MVTQEWRHRVRRWCDPVFDAAHCRFVWNDKVGDGAMLWEATATLFAERYPDSDIVESYGDQWPAPCIDYWVYLEDGRARLSVEGWTYDDFHVELTGDPDLDGAAIARYFAEVLRVGTT